MRQMVEKILTGYGSDLILRTGSGDQTLRGFLQPVTGKAKRYGNLEPTVLGLADPGQFIYIGPAQPEPRVGDELLEGESSYVLQNVRTLEYDGKPLYIWGMCVKKEGIGP